MKRIRVLMVLCVALAIAVLSAPRGSATTYNYFDEVYACDGAYSSTFSDCLSITPTQPCRYNAYSAYNDCLNAITTPMEQPDFCAAARAARDNCNLQYGGNLDSWDAYSSCIMASGINSCE